MPQAILSFRNILISTYPFLVGACLLLSAWLAPHSDPFIELEADPVEIEAASVVIP